MQSRGKRLADNMKHTQLSGRTKTLWVWQGSGKSLYLKACVPLWYKETVRIMAGRVRVTSTVPQEDYQARQRVQVLGKAFYLLIQE